MTLLTVVKDVCAAVGVQLPPSVFTNITGNRTMQEMVAIANEMAQRIAYDNPRLDEAKDHGDLCRRRRQDRVRPAGQLQAHAANQQCLALDLDLMPMPFIPDTDDWLHRRARNWNEQSYGEWTMLGGQIHLWPVMPVGEERLFRLSRQKLHRTGQRRHR